MKKRLVLTWLYVGLFMIIIQFVIGGITRLTDSGLSITEWEVIKGVVPPITGEQWDLAFTKYKNEANQQFKSLHADMTVREFKIIYYWEWFHRFWARSMGFVFLIPLLFFVFKGWISKNLGKRLGIVFFLALCAAVLGWIMVKSGLNNDQRTWVSAYKLVSHLSLGAFLLGYLYWTILHEQGQMRSHRFDIRSYRLAIILLALLAIQILLGGLMAGMKAGLLFPFYPLIVKFNVVIESIMSINILTEFIDYEASIGIKSLVQVLHRAVALVFVTMSIALVYWERARLHLIFRIFVFAVVLQYVLGVVTVILSSSGVPILWGVLHQLVALLLLIALLDIVYGYKMAKS